MQREEREKEKEQGKNKRRWEEGQNEVSRKGDKTMGKREEKR